MDNKNLKDHRQIGGEQDLFVTSFKFLPENY